MTNFDHIPRRGEVDLRSMAPEDVVSFFDIVTREEDRLLHGSSEHYLFLQPRTATDIRRKEGCNTAIYATQSVPMGLYRAVLNRRLWTLIYRFCSDAYPGQYYPPQSTRSESPDGIVGHFAFAEPMYSAIMAGDTDLTSDGYEYTFLKTSFIQEEEPHGDWQSAGPVDPCAVYRVSGGVSRILFQPPGAHARFEARQFTPQESAEHVQLIQAARAKKAATG